MADKNRIGLIQIYTGNGKGKSTAAFGLALRASGCGLRTAIVQFMKKGEWYSEIAAIQQLPLVEIYSYGGSKFLKKGTTPDAENLQLAKDAVAKARELMTQGEIDILVLDELNNAVFFDLLTEEEALSLFREKPAHMELVATGRNATQAMMDAADLVTEMREIKHPYQKGIQARKGIEF
ncbi:MAG: cob(I)yrinic acid a,c-diamide adenosyltransferase [Firmicutes bacterium]|nr:cob(I)yrinic acid a,c-diamide adenosyltransferase [Bacillota bacterium]